MDKKTEYIYGSKICFFFCAKNVDKIKGLVLSNVNCKNNNYGKVRKR